MAVKRRRKNDEDSNVEVTDLVLAGVQDVDEPLVKRAVSELNRIYVGKGLEMARMVGEYVLKHFFAGNSRAFDQNARGHASFRALAARDDLEISASALWYSVRILPQLRKLPNNIASALPLSHHRLLVHIKDDQKRLRLATRAANQGLSKRQLKVEIDRTRVKDDNKTGRPPLPAFVRGVTQLKRAVATAISTDVDDSEISRLSVKRAKKTVSELDSAMAELQALRDKVLQGIARVESRPDEATSQD